MAKFCLDCGHELVNPNAVICPNCGGAIKKQGTTGDKSEILAGILSLLIPGVGQYTMDR